MLLDICPGFPPPTRLTFVPYYNQVNGMKFIGFSETKALLFLAFFGLGSPAFAQSRFSWQEFSINGFRNPSIGLEFRHRAVSFHAGYYPTAFESGVTTKFIKVGTTLWFLPVGKRENPSSFYASVSYLRGLNREYKNDNAAFVDVGFRWMVWRGLNLRIGAGVLASPGKSVKLNPTPGISYSFFFN